MTSGYYLISKIEIPYYKYKGDALRIINQTARTVDEIIIGKKNSPDLIKKITTFKDSDGNIIERVFDYSDSPYRNKIYKRLDNVIRNNEYVISTIVKEYTLPRILKQAYKKLVEEGYGRTYLWNPIKFYTNHLSENIETGERILTKVLRTNLLKPNKEIHTFIEFPHMKKGKPKHGLKKILKFSVNTKDEYKINTKNTKESNVNFPQNDSFLGLRALDIEDSKTAFAQRFISERRLKNKRIIINTQYLPDDSEEGRIRGLFAPEDGSINFIKNYVYKFKSDVCEVARHETEHGWHFYLHARNTKGGVTTWEKKIYQIFGDLPEILKEEAQKCTDAIRSYVSVAENKELYQNNYIEKLADKEGKKAKTKYINEREEIQKEFPHIPKELL